MFVVVPVLIAVCCAVVFIYVGVPFIHGRVARLTIRRKAVKCNAIVLTFDDGPGSRLTPALLDMLGRYNAKATFFLLGRNVPGRESIVKQIAEQGHDIGTHGYDHLNYWKVSPFRALSDMKRGWEVIDTTLGKKPGKYPFRPPYGKLNFLCLLYLLFHRVPIVFWTTDVEDTWMTQPDARKISLEASRSGGIVSVAHDFDRRNPGTEKYVLDSTRFALIAAKESGMKILTISELLES